MVGDWLVKRSRLAVLVLFVLLSVLLLFLNFQYPEVYLQNTAYSFTALSIVYFLFWILFEELLTKRIKDSKTKYSLRKVFSVLGAGVFLVVFVAIWIVETQSILLAFGLIGAAIAFGIQDIFKNFIGGLMIFLNGLYRVGDRIEINQKFGDVIDVGVFYTTLMETREWVAGDQNTGRLTIIPNGGVLTGALQNYTRDFDFIWDEITLPITYDSDWNHAATMIIEIVKKETAHVGENSQRIMEKLEGKYYFTQRSLEPGIFISLTDNWITLGIRYVTEVRTRRSLHDRLSRILLTEIAKSENIKIASSTITITGFPSIQLKKEPNTD
jgi:small-conductance mechanosensitive channel